MSKILLITGATATGKTELAIECAKQFNGEIISSDSMQIYKYLDIGTAKPSQLEQQQAKHYMIDIVGPNEEFSVEQFVTQAISIINDIESRGKLPIIVGGTGLYLRSLIYNYSFCSSQKNQQIRDQYNKLLQEKGKEYLYNLLCSVDKESAQRIHINDTKKIIRALEIYKTTGKKKSDRSETEKQFRYDFIMIALTSNREVLYKRINDRVDKMFQLGLEDEIKMLLEKNLVNRDSQSMSAIGYKEFFDYFDHKQTLEETKELIKKNSRHYAKRQETFIRGLPNVKWFDLSIDKNQILEYISSQL